MINIIPKDYRENLFKKEIPFCDHRRGLVPLDETTTKLQVKMGRVGFEPTTNALKGHCSSAELPTQIVYCSTTSSILSEDSGICNFTSLKIKYGNIVNIDKPIIVAKISILFTLQMFFNFVDFLNTINR